MRRLHAQRSEAYTVSELCGLFGKSKQAYYKHDADSDLRRMALEEFAVQFIREVKTKDPGIGGMKVWAMYCRAFPDLDRIGRDRFCDIFDRYGFKIRRRRRVRTTDSRHNNPTYPNIVKEVIPTRFGEIIVGDITYIPLESNDGQRRFCYVSLLMDSYSKMILGSSVGMTLEARYPMEALSAATVLLSAHGVDLSRTGGDSLFFEAQCRYPQYQKSVRTRNGEFPGNVGNRAVDKSGISGRKQTDRREFQWLAGIVCDDPLVASDIGVQGVAS